MQAQTIGMHRSESIHVAKKDFCKAPRTRETIEELLGLIGLSQQNPCKCNRDWKGCYGDKGPLTGR